jgi:hypothetical protein
MFHHYIKAYGNHLIVAMDKAYANHLIVAMDKAYGTIS